MTPNNNQPSTSITEAPNLSNTKLAPSTKKLLAGLENIPKNWALTPVDGNKRPYRKDWQKEAPLSQDAIANDIKSGKAKGYGIRTGEISGGLLAIDEDGFAAAELLQKLANGDLPDTVSFTSNRPGRRQLLFRVPPELLGIFKTFKINTHIKDEDGKDQQLEFRWNGCQSVLPPSVHPTTGAYAWGNSPQDTEVAPCPNWIIELMRQKASGSEKTSQPVAETTPQPVAETTPKPKTPSGEPIPLIQCLSKSDRLLIAKGQAEGGRNDAGAKISRGLLGAAKRLEELGIPFEGIPSQLFNQYCERCTPPLEQSERDTIWNSAEADNPESTLSDDYLKTCLKCWYKNQNKKGELTQGGIPETVSDFLKKPLSDPNNSDDAPASKKKYIPPEDVLALQIFEEYRDRLAFNNDIQKWMRYEADDPGVWSQETEAFTESLVQMFVRGEGIQGFAAGYIAGVTRILRGLLIVRKWEEPSAKDLLPFKNGVLEISTGRLLPHSPGYRFTWALPRSHNAIATQWDSINKFLDHLSAGNAKIKDLLLCFANAILKGRGDLHKFLHLLGIGGSGKGSYARLLVDLIGEKNTHSSTLPSWCGTRFESANAYKKRLVIFWDEDKQVGDIGKFLSLTGGDIVPAEKKNVQGFSGYRYDGMVLMLSNLPIFTGSAASRVKRRVITVPCNKPVPLTQVRDVNAEFQEELAAFTNYILQIPDERVTSVLRGLVEVPETDLAFWESRIRTDSIAAFLNDCCIYDALAETPIGSSKEEGKDPQTYRYDWTIAKTLFGAYSAYCQSAGVPSKSLNNFSADLIETCSTILKWKIEKKSVSTGRVISGLRLRSHFRDAATPTYADLLSQKISAAVESGGSSGGLIEAAMETSNPYPVGIVEAVEAKSEILEQKTKNEAEEIYKQERGEEIYNEENNKWIKKNKIDPLASIASTTLDLQRFEASTVASTKPQPEPQLSLNSSITGFSVGDRVVFTHRPMSLPYYAITSIEGTKATLDMYRDPVNLDDLAPYDDLQIPW